MARLLGRAPASTNFTTPGVTADGYTIWWLDNLDHPGAVDWVFYETAPGHRVYIYKGIQGDATSFDPEMALVDSTEGGNAYVLTRPAGGPCF